MRKKLIFFLYIADDRSPQERISEGFVAKIHFGCLKRYRKVFDEAKFILSLKENLIGNGKLISQYIEYIVSLGYDENVEFIVEKNTSLREAEAFRYEITENGENDGKLVFFAHLRGEASDNENMRRWVFSNYYYGLSNIEEIEYWLLGCQKIYYGYPLTRCEGQEGLNFEVLPKNRFYYLGTILWINISLLKEHMETRGLDWPKMTGRFYSENFPGNTALYEMTATYSYISAMGGCDMYSQFDMQHEEWCSRSGNSLEKFNEEYEKMKNGD